MKLFLWNQGERKVESRELLRRAVLQYETSKQNTEEYRESKQDSLFEFVSAGQPLRAAGDIMIAELPGGKPCVVDGTGNRLVLECSVTHTGDWWLCSVGGHPMGIDAELRSRVVNPALVRKICTEDEQAWLQRAEELRPEGGNERLLWLWIRKEAYVKYLGTGIKEGLNTFSVFEVGAKELGDEHCSFHSVNLRNVSGEAAKELAAVVYCPEEEIESVEWLR